MNLFLDALPEDLFKTAAFAARLSETPENWPQELTSELLRQLPFLSDYDINVNLQTVEANRGYGFGFADISNKTERPEVEHEETGLPHLRIPLVIMDKAVKPFNVFLDGERVQPLTEDRIREALFNPQTFDLSTSAPRDPSLVDATTPPGRSGSGGEVKTAGIMGAFANKGGLTNLGAGALTAGVVTPIAVSEYKKAKKQPSQKTASIDKEAISSEMVAGAVRNVAAGAKGLNPLRAQKVMGKMQGMAQRAETAVGANAAAGNRPAAMNALRRKVNAGTATQELKNFSMKQPAPAFDAGGATVAARPQMKKVGSLLLEIAPTIREKDAADFVEKVASDAFLQAGFRRAEVSDTLIEVFENTKRASATDRLEILAAKIEPTAVTFQKLPGGDFLVKSASVNAFAEGPQAKGQVVPQEEVAEAIGPDNAQSMQPGQTATAVDDPVQQSPIYETNEKMVDEFGEWLVQDQMGNRIMGWVFPKTLAWDGNFTPQPIALFTNGSAYAYQDAVAGELVGKSTTFPSDAPRGDGVFYSTQGGKAICTSPLTIGSSMAGPDGLPRFVGTDVWGTQVQVSFVEGLKEPMRVSDMEYALPDHWKFMRLNNQTQLAQDPVQMNKAASARAEATSVTLFYNGGYNLRGGCGLDKISMELKNDLDPVGAEFLLGVLGLDSNSSKAKIAEARKKGWTKIAGLKTITTLGERYTHSEKTAAVLLTKLPDLRKDLIKEAASLDDEGTVNNILALNFINPENLSTFIGYIPELEMTSEKLAEMWLYAVLGMNELPEEALERSMKNLEEVLVGLKSVAHAES